MEELELFSSFLKNVTLEELPFIKRFCIWQGASLAKRRKSSAKLCSLRLPSLLSYTDKIVPVDDRLREAFPGVRADVLQVLASVISQKDVQKLTEKIHSPIDPNKTKVDPHILAIQKYYPRIPLSVFQALGDVYSKNVKAPAPKILYRNLLEQVSEISLLLFPFERKLPNLEDLERRFVFPDGTNLMKVMANRTYICSMEIKYAERLESVFFAKERELSCFPGFTFYTKGVGSEKDVGKKRYGIVFYEKDVHFFEISNKTLKVEFLCTKKGAGMCYFSTKGLKDFHKIDVPGFMELRCFLGKLLTTGEKSSLSEKLLGGINKIFQGYISEDIEIFTGALKKVLLSIANEEIEEGDIASFGLKLNYACFLSTLFCPQWVGCKRFTYCGF